MLTNVLPQQEEMSSSVSEANAIRKKLAESSDVIYVSIDIPNEGSFWSDKIHLSDFGLTKYLRKFEETMTYHIETSQFIYRFDDFPALSTDNYRPQRQKNPTANNKKVTPRSLYSYRSVLKRLLLKEVTRVQFPVGQTKDYKNWYS